MKPENERESARDCGTDYKEEESPWVVFANQRPDDGQRCILYPGHKVTVFNAKLGVFEFSFCKVRAKVDTPTHWMPFPADPACEEDDVTLIKVLGLPPTFLEEGILAVLGLPSSTQKNVSPPKVSDDDSVTQADFATNRGDE